MTEKLNNFYLNSAEKIQYSGVEKTVRNQIHKKIEQPFNESFVCDRLIEVGALFGSHRNFVKHNFIEYYETDILIHKNWVQNFGKFKLIRQKQNAVDLSSFKNGFFDRLISTCLLIHLEDPEAALNEWKRVVKKDGYISIWVQLEPSLLLRIIQKTISKNKNINFEEIHYLEHIHYYKRVDYLIRKVFKKNLIKKNYYPFNFLSWNFNTTAIYTIKL